MLEFCDNWPIFTKIGHIKSKRDKKTSKQTKRIALDLNEVDTGQQPTRVLCNKRRIFELLAYVQNYFADIH